MRCEDCSRRDYRTMQDHQALELPRSEAGPLTPDRRSMGQSGLEKLNRPGLRLGESHPPTPALAFFPGDLGEPVVAEDNLELQRGDRASRQQT